MAGFLAAAATWLPQVDALRAAGPPGGLPRPPLARPVRRAGRSMGASTWWSYLDLFGPGRLRGLLSVDQTPKMLNADGWESGFYGFTQANAGDYFDGAIPTPGAAPTGPACGRRWAGWAARLGPDEPLMGTLTPATQPLLRDHARQDWRDVVARADIPLLMVASSDSQYWRAEHAFAAARLAPRGRGRGGGLRPPGELRRAGGVQRGADRFHRRGRLISR